IPASTGLICRSAVIAAVTAGLKCAPETTARVWISTNKTKTWTRPITEKSMKGSGFVADGWTTYRETTAQMKKTSNSVPMNSARYAAGPRSCTLRPPEIGEFPPLGFDTVLGILLVLVASVALGACGGDDAEQATLALDFQPNAAHAGIYAALGDDLDADRELELRVRVPSASTDSLKLLAAGRADVSVVDIHDLGLARQEGEPIVGVGALVQRPLAAVIAR